MQKKNNLLPHLVALTVVIIWGSTFVFTKLLLLNGLSAAQIFLLRFILAYTMLLVWSLSRKGHRWFCKSLKDELKMLLLGISGGSLYFLTENSAMNYTTATNDSLIVCACPLFTTLIVALFYKSEHISGRQLLGTLIALVGMAVVVMNGQFVLQLSPKGDLLAFTACMCWVVYSLLMMKNDFIAGNLNFENPDEETACIDVVPETRKAHFDIFMSNSFGFGGTNSTLIIKNL